MKLRIYNGQLEIDLGRAEKVLALKGPLKIPLKHIKEATIEAPEPSLLEIRAPGTYVPRLIKAGTYYTKRGKEFWYVTRSKGCLTIELKNEAYKRLVLSVDENVKWVERINDAISKYK